MEIKLTRENIKVLIRVSNIDLLLSLKYASTNMFEFHSRSLLGVGTNTFAITIEWALAKLINHPNIMKKAVEEKD